jgi:hypothetical protein
MYRCGREPLFLPLVDATLQGSSQEVAQEDSSLGDCEGFADLQDFTRRCLVSGLFELLGEDDSLFDGEALQRGLAISSVYTHGQELLV